MTSRDKTQCWVSFPEQHLSLISRIIVFLYGLWAFVSLLGMPMLLARDTFAEAWSTLVGRSLEPACCEEIKKVEGNSVES